MNNAPQPAQEGSLSNMASIKEVSIEEAASLMELSVEAELLDFGTTKLVVVKDATDARYAVLTTASGRAAKIMLQ